MQSKVSFTILFQILLINVILTLTNEAIARTALNFATQDSSTQLAFLLSTPGGFVLNPQSLINLIMTIISTIFGFPVYYVTRKTNRFLFFILAALAFSVLAQLMVAYFYPAYLFSFRRLAFDLVYAASFKFLVFDFWRKDIIVQNQTFLNRIFPRAKQDLTLSFIKTFLINVLVIRS